MAVQTVCPRCGARDSFLKGYLPETCVCRVCQSQLDWREIPGCGPDCRAAAVDQPESGGTSSPEEDPTGGEPGGERRAETPGAQDPVPASGSDA